MPIVSGIGSLVGGIVGGAADKRAGKTLAAAGNSAATAIGTAGNEAGAATTAATNTAVSGVNNATNTAVSGVNNATAAGEAGVNTAVANANTTNKGVLNSQLNNVNPYLQEGNTGTTNLQNLAANGGFQAPTAAQAAATPGEQFQMQQGLQGVEQQMGASGGAATGGALKALTQYGQNVASTYYQNAFNNSLNAYNTNVNTNLAMAGQGETGAGMANNALANYGSLSNSNTMGAGYYNAGLGLQGATTAGGMGMSGATTAGNMGMSGAITAGNQNMTGTEEANQFYMQGQEGLAAGQAGQGNMLGNGIAGLANGIGGTAMMGMGMPYFGGGTGGGYFGGGGMSMNSINSGYGSGTFGQGTPNGIVGGQYGPGIINPISVGDYFGSSPTSSYGSYGGGGSQVAAQGAG